MSHISADDVRNAAPDVLRHRVAINFQGQSDGITADKVVAAVLDHVRA